VDRQIVHHGINQSAILIPFDTPVLLVPGVVQLIKSIVDDGREVMQNPRRVFPGDFDLTTE
jgi:hypothetical protein